MHSVTVWWLDGKCKKVGPLSPLKTKNNNLRYHSFYLLVSIWWHIWSWPPQRGYWLVCSVPPSSCHFFPPLSCFHLPFFPVAISGLHNFKIISSLLLSINSYPGSHLVLILANNFLICPTSEFNWISCLYCFNLAQSRCWAVSLEVVLVVWDRRNRGEARLPQIDGLWQARSWRRRGWKRRDRGCKEDVWEDGQSFRTHWSGFWLQFWGFNGWTKLSSWKEDWLWELWRATTRKEPVHQRICSY